MSPQDSPQHPWSAGATAPGPGALHSPPREPTLAPPGSRHRPVISSQAESRQAGLRPAELARATETCVHATACTGHLGCVGPWAGGILQTEMRRGRPSHTRSVVRAPLALLLVPSFRAWIPVATGALLPAAFSLCSTQQPAGAQGTSVPLLRTFHWLPISSRANGRALLGCARLHVLWPP